MTSPGHRIVGMPYITFWFLWTIAAVGWAQETADPFTTPSFDTEAATTHRQITWDDFKADSSGSETRKREREEAWIATAITAHPFEIKVRLINRGYWVAVPTGLSFYATMDKQASSVTPGAHSDLLLTHEQGHFDLTEIASRRLMQSLAGIEAQGTTEGEARTTLMETLQAAHEEAARLLDDLQTRYDRETRHGRARKRQEEWNGKIALWLGGVATPEELGALKAR